eukprot:3532457-Amphidinium_carterae.2
MEAAQCHSHGIGSFREDAPPIEAVLKNARYITAGSVMDKITAMTTLWQAPTIDREHSSLQAPNTSQKVHNLAHHAANTTSYIVIPMNVVAPYNQDVYWLVLRASPQS